MWKPRRGEGSLPAWAAAACALSMSACAALSPPPAAPEKARKPEQAAVPAAAAPEAVKRPPAGFEPREERRLTKELGQEIEGYYRLLKEKNVEGAVAYVEPEFQKAYLDELWVFAATYAVEGVQATSYQFFPHPEGVLAKVKVTRTLFEKGSVVPQKSEVSMTWMQRNGRWLIRPQ